MRTRGTLVSASVVHVSFHSGQADVEIPETVGDFGAKIFELSIHGRDAFGYDADLVTRVFPKDLSAVKTFVRSIEALIDPIKSESDELQEIQEALERITDGSFGICDICDKTIPKMRLKAIPYTRLCIPCKQKEENE